MLTQEGYTALMEAADNGHDGLVDLLIGNGAKVNLQDKVKKVCAAPSTSSPLIPH